MVGRNLCVKWTAYICGFKASGWHMWRWVSFLLMRLFWFDIKHLTPSYYQTNAASRDFQRGQPPETPTYHGLSWLGQEFTVGRERVTDSVRDFGRKSGFVKAEWHQETRNLKEFWFKVFGLSISLALLLKKNHWVEHLLGCSVSLPPQWGMCFLLLALGQDLSRIQHYFTFYSHFFFQWTPELLSRVLIMALWMAWWDKTGELKQGSGLILYAFPLLSHLTPCKAEFIDILKTPKIGYC